MVRGTASSLIFALMGATIVVAAWLLVSTLGVGDSVFVGSVALFGPIVPFALLGVWAGRRSSVTSLVGLVVGTVIAAYWTGYQIGLVFGPISHVPPELYGLFYATMYTTEVLLAGLVGFVVGRRAGRSAWIAARKASGTMSDGEAAFYREGRTGRAFLCGRCGRPLSSYWRSCQRCHATFDLYPPLATAQLPPWGS
jgi:hypothetical protein